MSTRKLKLARELTPEDLLAIKAVAFFTQTAIHLGATARLDADNIVYYMGCADRVQDLLIEET
jgi:hypothetical protein